MSARWVVREESANVQGFEVWVTWHRGASLPWAWVVKLAGRIEANGKARTRKGARLAALVAVPQLVIARDELRRRLDEAARSLPEATP